MVTELKLQQVKTLAQNAYNCYFSWQNFFSATVKKKKLDNEAQPELPVVSTAVPKKSTYSVREAWSTHMEPMRPPAFIKIHSRSDAGKMCPGYLALRSLWTFSNAFFTSNEADASEQITSNKINISNYIKD